MRLPPALGLVLAALASPASAALAPEYYEAARRDAPDVVTIEVLYLETPTRPRRGVCAVTTRVIRVERGDRYTPGEILPLRIHCRAKGTSIPSGGIVWQDMDQLADSRFGRAFLNADGQLALDQYEILDTADDTGDLR